MENKILDLAHNIVNTKAWQHDWSNHLSVLLFLVKSGEYQELENYIENLTKEIKVLEKQLLNVDNVILKAIISQKIEVARNLGIEFILKLDIPEEIRIKNTDLSALINNLLDNSIEANFITGTYRWIKLEIFKMKENLYITVKNTINCEIKEEKGIYKTTKEDGKGIGLKQIDKIVKSYKGSIIRKIEDNIFITKILIPFKKKP